MPGGEPRSRVGAPSRVPCLRAGVCLLVLGGRRGAATQEPQHEELQHWCAERHALSHAEGNHGAAKTQGL